MTPEERFERIERTLIEIAKSNAKTQALIDARAEQQQRMIDELLIDRSEHERMLNRLVVNHEQHEMRIAEHEKYLGRIERACDFIASSQAALIAAMRGHISDGHGGEEKS